MQDEKKPLDSDREQLVCPSCLQRNDEYADYCSKCGAPISPTVNFDPFKRIASQGWLFRTAASDSRRMITVIGIWLLFLPYIVTLVVLATTLDLGEKNHFLILAFLLILSVIPGIIIFRTTLNYIRNRARIREYEDETQEPPENHLLL